MSSRQSHSDDRWRAFASPFLRHVPIDAGESSALRRARAGHQAAGAGEPLASAMVATLAAAFAPAGRRTRKGAVISA